MMQGCRTVYTYGQLPLLFSSSGARPLREGDFSSLPVPSPPGQGPPGRFSSFRQPIADYDGPQGYAWHQRLESKMQVRRPLSRKPHVTVERSMSGL